MTYRTIISAFVAAYLSMYAAALAQVPGTFNPLLSAASSALPSISFTSSAVDGSALSTYTFASQSVGTASATRKVVVPIMFGYAAAPTVSSVTVCGNAASAVASTSLSSANLTVVIYELALTTGTSCSVVVALSGAALSMGISAYAVYDLSSPTAASVYTSSANPGTASINVAAGGVTIFMATNAGALSTYTWANVTEDYDQTVSAPNAISYSGASALFATVQTGLSVTATRTAGIQPLMTGVVYR